MTKITHLTSVHPPHENRILYKECISLAKAGYDVTLIVPHECDEVVNGVTIRAIPKPSGRKERMASTVKQIYQAALRENSQIYHIHDPELLPVGQLLRRKGKSVIFDMHENLPMSLLHKSWIRPSLRGASKIAYSVSERAFLKGISVVFAEDSYPKHYPWIKHHVTVRNMPFLENLSAIHEDRYSDFTIGYIGRVATTRGSVVILEALGILAARHKMIGFECVGPTSPQEQALLTDMVQTLGLENIRFRGRQMPEAGWRIMGRCHVGMAVLQDIPNYVESYPTKIFEYMALGLPVIASGFPLYRSIVEQYKCGICVNPADAVEVADAIQWILEHPTEADKMAKCGREVVGQRFNWTAEEKKLLTFYQEVLAV